MVRFMAGARWKLLAALLWRMGGRSWPIYLRPGLWGYQVARRPGRNPREEFSSWRFFVSRLSKVSGKLWTDKGLGFFFEV